MPITIQKQKEKKVQEVVAEPVATHGDPETMTDEELADYYGTLEDQCTATLNNPIFTNLELARKELMKRVTTAVPPEDGAEIKGESWLLEIGACKANPRQITDIVKVSSYMGTNFYKVAKVNLTDLDKYLTPEQVSQVTTSDTGYGKARAITARYLGPKT